MQANASMSDNRRSNGLKLKHNQGLPSFSTYVSKDLNRLSTVAEKSHQTVSDQLRINVSSSSSDSSGSWTQGGGLPPPPSEQDLLIQPSSIPEGPAKAWDTVQSDEEDLSDEGVAETEMDIAAADSDSGSDDHESECTTEIYIPRPSTSGVTARPPTVHQRRVVSSYQSGRAGMSHHTQRRSEVIPSVSNDNLSGYRSPQPLKLTSALTSEDIATNIDSGISNETSNVHSHEGTVVKNRTMSVSSSSHYSSSYSCGSRGDIPSPNIGQSRIDDITVYMREAKVSRVVSFLSASYAVILILLGLIFPIFELGGTAGNSFALEGFYIYLYGLSIFFLIYVYATVIKDKKHKDTMRKQSMAATVHGNGLTTARSAPVHTQCTRESHDTMPVVGSLFLRITVVLFCVGGLVDSGLKFGVHLGDQCATHFLTTLQPVAQAFFMFFEVYFVFSNTKMCVRQYPVVAKFGMMHLIATNICIYVLCTLTEINNSVTSTQARMVKMQGNSNQTYYMAGDTETLAKALSVLNYNEESPHLNCTHNSLMVDMAYKSKPYTFPCTVQFCILVSSIIFVMWKKVDVDSDTQCSDCREHTKRSSRSAARTIDCGSTSRGLFFGIIALVAAVASLIIFFVFTATNWYNQEGTLLIHIYQIAVYLLMTVIAVVVLLKLRPLDHNSCKSTSLEDILIVICIIALLTKDLVGIITGILNLKLKGLLVLATSSAELIQSVVQMAAIVMGLKLCVPDVPELVDTNQRHKPGRECVTFLIVANIGLWVLSLFSHILSQGFERNLSIAGHVSWETVLNVVAPFVAFYHLFSASCLIDIWYNAYRMPRAPIVQV